MMRQRRRMLANIDPNLLKPSMLFNDYLASGGVLYVNWSNAKSIRFPCKPNTAYAVTGKQTGDVNYTCYYGFFNTDTLAQGSTSTNGQVAVGRLITSFNFSTSSDTKYVVITTGSAGPQDFTKWVIKEV